MRFNYQFALAATLLSSLSAFALADRPTNTITDTSTWRTGAPPTSINSEPQQTIQLLTVGPRPTSEAQCKDFCDNDVKYEVKPGNRGQAQAELDCIVQCNSCAGVCVWSASPGMGHYQCKQCY